MLSHIGLCGYITAVTHWSVRIYYSCHTLVCEDILRVSCIHDNSPQRVKAVN